MVRAFFGLLILFAMPVFAEDRAIDERADRELGDDAAALHELFAGAPRAHLAREAVVLGAKLAP